MGKYSGKSCRLACMISLTTTFFLVEIFVGYFTNSVALVADSFHMISDVIALLIAFISVRISTKKWSKNTFGWARAEVLGALINSVFLLALCFSIFVEALKRFFDNDIIRRPQLILYVGIIGLIINLVGLFLFHEHGHSHGGHGHSHSIAKKCDPNENQETHPLNLSSLASFTKPEGKKVASSSQMNMRGVFLHVFADALGSIVVIISALVIWLTEWEYKFYVDPALSMVTVLLISRTTWPLLISSCHILLQTVPSHIQVDVLQKKLITDVRGVIAVHELHIWQLAGNRIIASAHVRCNELSDYAQISESVKHFFHKEGIHSTTVQLEFVSSGNEKIGDNKECMFNLPCIDDCQDQTCCKGSSAIISKSKYENGISVSIIIPPDAPKEDLLPSKKETNV